MLFENEEEVRRRAIEFALLCEALLMPLTEISEIALKRVITWFQIDPEVWENELELKSDQALLLILGSDDDHLIITTRKAMDCSEAVFACTHEIGHFLLKHSQEGKIIYGSPEADIEVAAGYFALCLFSMTSFAFSFHLPKGITDSKLAELGKLFLPSLFRTTEEAMAEIRNIREWRKGYYKEYEG